MPSRVATWSHANRHVNAFASGVLAVAIASPCTAPFMGAALGYALGERAQVTLGVFVALGVGMALPYFALAWFPAVAARVAAARAPWMVRLKQLLAFPLYATVAWLVWVLGAQVGNDAVMRIGIALVLVAFALWAWRAWRGGGASRMGRRRARRRARRRCSSRGRCSPATRRSQRRRARAASRRRTAGSRTRRRASPS